MSSKPKTKPPWKKIYAALPFVCKYCRGLFPDFKFYRRHVRSHESRYKKFWHSQEWRAARRYSTSWVEDAMSESAPTGAQKWPNCNGSASRDRTVSSIIKFAGKHANGGDSPVDCNINSCQIDRRGSAAKRAIQRRSSAPSSSHRNLPAGLTLEQAALIAHYQRLQLSKHKAPERYSDSEDCCGDGNYGNYNSSSHDAMLHDLGQLLSAHRRELEQCECHDCIMPSSNRQTLEEPIIPSYHQQQRHRVATDSNKQPNDCNYSNQSPGDGTKGDGIYGYYTAAAAMGPMLPCPHCPVSFDRADRLSLHIKNHYTGNKMAAITPGSSSNETMVEMETQGTDNDVVSRTATGREDLKFAAERQISNERNNSGGGVAGCVKNRQVDGAANSPNNHAKCANANASNNNNGNVGYHGNKVFVSNGDQVNMQLRCQDCDREFPSETELKVHQKYHHHNHHQQTISPGYQSVTRKHSSTAHDNINLTLAADTDMKNQEVQSSSSPPTTKPAYPCAYCPKTFTYWSSLKTHEFSHTGQPPFSCDSCDAKFMQCSELKLHEKSHLGANPFKCGKCDRLFKHRPSLTSHERSHHGEDGKNTCPVCLKTFSVGSNLRDHLRIHSGERPYQCASCGRGFIQKSHLRKHVMIHTGERPFRCSFCNKGFTQRGDVRRHEKIHRKVK